MKVRQFLKEVVDATGHLLPDQEVHFFDGASAWDIELIIAKHWSGDSLWITRKPHSVEQECADLLFSIVATWRFREADAPRATAKLDELVKQADALAAVVRRRSQL
jgi:hypothetical protein